MPLTTKQYDKLSPLARCLLLVAAFDIKETNGNRFISVIKRINDRLPYAFKRSYLSNSDISSELLILNSFGWVDDRGKVYEYKLAAALDDFEVLNMIFLRDKALFKRVYSVVTESYPAPQTWTYYHNRKTNDDYIVRDFKVAVISDDIGLYRESFQAYVERTRYHSNKELEKKYLAFYESLIDTSETGYFQFVGRKIAGNLLIDVLVESLNNFNPIDEIQTRVETILQEMLKADHKKAFEQLFDYYAFALVASGKLKELVKLLEFYEGKYYSKLYKGFLFLLMGDFQQADTFFQTAYQAYQKVGNRRTHHFPNLQINIFYFLSRARYLGQHYDTIENGLKFYESYDSEIMDCELELLMVIEYFAKNKLGTAKTALAEVEVETTMDALLYGWVCHWVGMRPYSSFLDYLQKIYTLAKNNGFKWIQLEAAALLEVFSKETLAIYTAEVEVLSEELGLVSLVHLMPKVDNWERVLLGLEGIVNAAQDSVVQKSENLIFLLDLDGREVEVQMKIQTIAKKGGWTAGRKARLEDLKNYARKYASPAEQKLIQSFSYYGNEEMYDAYFADFYYDEDFLLKNLVGLSNLYHLKNPKIALELVEKPPKLLIEEFEDRFNIQTDYLPYKSGVNIFKTGPTTYTISEYSDKQFQMLSFFSAEQVSFPKTVSQRLTSIVEELKQVVEVESLMDKDVGDLPLMAANTIPHIHLLPVRDTFQLDVFAKPYATSLQYFRPGEGRQLLVDRIEEVSYRIERNLLMEQANTAEITAALTLPKKARLSEHSWRLEEPEDCLKVLSALHPLRLEEKVVVEWPKGGKLKLVGDLSTEQLALRISKGKDYWFGLDGEIQVNENLVFSLQKLLELTENSNKGYIEISDGHFLALTKKFQKQLDTARGVLQKNKDGDLQFHNLAGLALEDLFAGAADVEADKLWKEQQQKLAKAKKIRPKVPSTFKAELRSYQKEGFQWMMRLAAWGVGCCLADDMGLGKTIQGLAVLVSRQSKGPALVVAPASVCRNWLRETEKFAPSLNPMLLNTADREETIKGLRQKDLLIVSYGLLHTQIDLLKEVEFSTVILDEAQAIKNYNTKRFKAAIQLQGAFKIATTGTPIENHLGELWSLFQYINPGLLGSKKLFADRFGVPIKNGDKAAMTQLKTLVQPFILRRKKSEVLKDLPPKTEIIYNVEMSLEERAFYEANRRNALEKLESELEEQQAGTQHLMILAEITRMRRACCHPSLVDASTRLPGAKLEAFKEILSDLRENGHRALVFSQFVDYLKIVENYIQKESISYQYLDGSTPLKKRELAVNAFQKGEGDLFLISLKAGGVGLNLTAADYVIILDPWWNPAVEDQAADRAHRIGQQKPVTVYRLVIENTIEEKIVQLHHQKRDLADSLLQGTNASTKITAKDLMKILKNER